MEQFFLKILKKVPEPEDKNGALQVTRNKETR